MGTLAYFSHSHRSDDRDVNSFFWELFHEHGLFFTVDPESSVFSIPYLESMMLRDARKTHPCLVPFDQLTEAAKDCDREVTRATLLAMQALGVHVVKRG